MGAFCYHFLGLFGVRLPPIAGELQRDTAPNYCDMKSM